MCAKLDSKMMCKRSNQKKKDDIIFIYFGEKKFIKKYTPKKRKKL
jgi:hypothetical protein